MDRISISENVKRQLFAESMGKCMNPACEKDLFIGDGDIVERAHIIPYCKTADNAFENLIILCPNCHTQFDKGLSFSEEEIKGWKQERKNKIAGIFNKKYSSFEALSEVVVPLLLENKTLYEKYYLNSNRALWNKFELKVLANNKALKGILQNNLNLIQRHPEKAYSNLEYIYTFFAHIDEFEQTRVDEEKMRQILFPTEINSMFGIAPVDYKVLPSTEALECLISKLIEEDKFEQLYIGNDNPYIKLKGNEEPNKIFLRDTPRLRQLYYTYDCFQKAKVRFESLNFALKHITLKQLNYTFESYTNLKVIFIKGVKVIFIYEYCLSKVGLLELSPDENSVVVNLHNWNGSCCISKEAYELAKKLKVKLLPMEDFYDFVNELKFKG